jgi:hypothetical protein
MGVESERSWHGDHEKCNSYVGLNKGRFLRTAI